MLRLCTYFQHRNQSFVAVKNVDFGLYKSVRIQMVKLCEREEGVFSAVPSMYNPFFVSRLREMLGYDAYGLILDAIFLDKLQFDGINYGSVQMMQ